MEIMTIDDKELSLLAEAEAERVRLEDEEIENALREMDPVDRLAAAGAFCAMLHYNGHDERIEMAFASYADKQMLAQQFEIYKVEMGWAEQPNEPEGADEKELPETEGGSGYNPYPYIMAEATGIKLEHLLEMDRKLVAWCESDLFVGFHRSAMDDDEFFDFRHTLEFLEAERAAAMGFAAEILAREAGASGA